MVILCKESRTLKRPCNNGNKSSVDTPHDTETSSPSKKAKIDLGYPAPDEANRKADTPRGCNTSVNLLPSVSGLDCHLVTDEVPDKEYTKLEEQNAVSGKVDGSLHSSHS